MNKREFMERLSKLLMDISHDERIEALQYYEDYFADAGEEKEADIIAELGSPEALAKTIRAELILNGATERKDEFTERGYFDKNDGKKMDYPNYVVHESQYENRESENSYQNKGEKKKVTGSQIILIVIAGIFVAPFIIGIASGAFGIIVGIFATLFGISIGLGIAGVACIATGVVVTVIGIMNLAVLPAVGILVAGIGFLVFGIGFLFIMISSFCMKGIRVICRGSIHFIKSLFGKRRVYA